ncbi:hypothetical protein HK098_002493 [Nowakowskiella sp. JEL0407]|nr:hypothetical protein HK098_002493 [Nowakowskiella sp. JEL0407]
MGIPSLVFSNEDISVLSTIIARITSVFLLSLPCFFAAQTSRLGISYLVSKSPVSSLVGAWRSKGDTWYIAGMFWSILAISTSVTIPLLVNYLSPSTILFIPNSPPLKDNFIKSVAALGIGFNNLTLPSCASRKFTWGAPTGYNRENMLGVQNSIDNGECPETNYFSDWKNSIPLSPRFCVKDCVDGKPTQVVGSGATSGSFLVLENTTRLPFQIPFLQGGNWAYRSYQSVVTGYESNQMSDVYHVEATCSVKRKSYVCSVPSSSSLCYVDSANFNCSSLTTSNDPKRDCIRITQSANSSVFFGELGKGLVYSFGEEQDYSTGITLIYNASVQAGKLTYIEHDSDQDPYHSNALPWYGPVRSSEEQSSYRLARPFVRKEVSCDIQVRKFTTQRLTGISSFASILLWWADSASDVTIPVFTDAYVNTNIFRFAVQSALHSNETDRKGGIVEARVMRPESWISLIVFLIFAGVITSLAPKLVEQLLRNAFTFEDPKNLDAPLPLGRKMELLEKGTYVDLVDKTQTVASWYAQKRNFLNYDKNLSIPYANGVSH